MERRRREALQIGGQGKLQIDISKHEFVDGKEAADLDGYRIFVYPPQMVVVEKLRAICQQMPEYKALVRGNATARARDFIDIQATVERFAIEPGRVELADLIVGAFAAKRVPLDLLGLIQNTKAFHEPDFDSVQATMHSKVRLREFEFYFRFVCDFVNSLHPIGDE